MPLLANLHQVQLRARHRMLESESTEHKQSEEATESSSNQQGRVSPGTVSEEKQGDASQSKDTSDQRATAQDPTQQSSSNTATDQRATAQGEVQPSATGGTTQSAEKSTASAAASTDSARKKTDYNWIMQPTGLEGTHDIYMAEYTSHLDEPIAEN